MHEAIRALVPVERQLVLATRPDVAGGNVGLLRQLPRLARWLAAVDADWINPHYLTSHGTLVWASARLQRLRGRILASAWGSDVLVTPELGALYRWALRRVLASAALATSDSQHMAERMKRYGSREVMVFPFGMESMPPEPGDKQPWLVFANRGLEPIYRPRVVLAWFRSLRAWQPAAQLVVANDGSLRAELEAWVREQGLGDSVRFVGRLDQDAQAAFYRRARWTLSLPASDSVAVSVIEAMAHGCLPVLSDLPANRELVRHGDNGLIVADGDQASAQAMQPLLDKASDIAARNRAWVAEHGVFGPCVDRLIERLRSMPPVAEGTGR
jgi:glycosyltransferase involved in cell wall biosynthesis